MTFLPKDYSIPSNSNYLRLKAGDNTFRVLAPAIVGFEYFTDKNKPVRSEEPFEETPDIKSGGQIKAFWAFPIWNYEDKRVQILELTQKTIMMAIEALANNGKWGDPMNYDITITRKGTTMNDTEYSVVPNPKEPLAKEIKDAFVKTALDLKALFSSKDPFKPGEGSSMKPAHTAENYPKDENVDSGDVPF